MRGAMWWVDRWRKSTAYTDMTLAEQGAYRNLLDELWLREGPLPDDDRILGRISGDPVEWPTVRAAVMARFTKTPEGWVNETQTEVMAATRRYSDSQSAKGRKGADVRWNGRANGREDGRAIDRANGTANGPAMASVSVSGSVSESESEKKIPSESPSSPAVTPVTKRKTDPLILDLKNRLGSGAKVCGDQIRALRGAGWDDARIAQAISEFAEPGMAPWEWTKKARGVVPTNGHFKTMADRSDEIVRSILGGGA